MSKEFIKGNTYVFTKKKFIEAEGRKAYCGCKGWVNKSNGNEVTVLNKIDSVTNAGFFMSPEWCKCVKVQSNIRGVE
ncbi:MAG: hypothetical protein RR851_13025 [Clostridium sp.]